MVGGRCREPPSQYCRPGEPAIANHQTHHEVNNELSRRLVEECGITSHSHRTGRNCESLSRSTSASARGGQDAPEEMRREQKAKKMRKKRGAVTAGKIVGEVDELSWRCSKRSPFHKASAWIFCAGSDRQVAHPSHLMRAQLGLLCEVTPAPRTSEPFDGLSARIFCAG